MSSSYGYNIEFLHFDLATVTLRKQCLLCCWTISVYLGIHILLYIWENMILSFLSSCVHVLELEKCDIQTPSPRSPVCPEDIRNQRTGLTPSSADTSKLRNIRVCTYSCFITSRFDIKVCILSGITISIHHTNEHFD